MLNRRILAAAALVGSAAMLLAGCSQTTIPQNKSDNGGGTSSSLSGTITLYTSEPEDKIDEVIAAFNQKQPNVTVKVFRGGTGEVEARVAAEKKTGKVNGDVLLVADIPSYQQYAKEGILEKWVPSDTQNFVKNMVDPDGYYVGTRIIPTIIAYNTNAKITKPTSWKDLTKAEYKGKIAMPSPDVSGAAAFNAALWISMPELGKPWLTKLMQNKPTVLQSNGPVSQAVASGSEPIGVVVDYLVRDLASKGSPIAASYPSDGVPYVSEPASVFSDSQNKPAAKAFVSFLVSKEGQKLAVKQNYLPVRTDVGTPKDTPALKDINLLNPDLAKIGAEKPAAVKFFDSLVAANK